MKLILLFSILAVSSGCTNLALKRATLAHAQSSTDLRYREVIENLAMIASNPDLLPSYTSIYSGTSDINDIGKATSTSAWARTAFKPFRYHTFFSQQTADFVGSWAVKMNWTLDPTVVPEKLRAIRAACRMVINGPGYPDPDQKYLGSGKSGNPTQSTDGKASTTTDPVEPNYYFDVYDQLKSLQDQPKWLYCSDRRLDVPHDACLWAGCNGNFVW